MPLDKTPREDAPQFQSNGKQPTWLLLPFGTHVSICFSQVDTFSGIYLRLQANFRRWVLCSIIFLYYGQIHGKRQGFSLIYCLNIHLVILRDVNNNFIKKEMHYITNGYNNQSHTDKIQIKG